MDRSDGGDGVRDRDSCEANRSCDGFRPTLVRRANPLSVLVDKALSDPL